MSLPDTWLNSRRALSKPRTMLRNADTFPPAVREDLDITREQTDQCRRVARVDGLKEGA